MTTINVKYQQYTHHQTHIELDCKGTASDEDRAKGEMPPYYYFITLNIHAADDYRLDSKNGYLICIEDVNRVTGELKTLADAIEKRGQYKDVHKNDSLDLLTVLRGQIARYEGLKERAQKLLDQHDAVEHQKNLIAVKKPRRCEMM